MLFITRNEDDMPEWEKTAGSCVWCKTVGKLSRLEIKPGNVMKHCHECDREWWTGDEEAILDEQSPGKLGKELVKQDFCPICLGELDTGWECTKCGYDAIKLKPK
jgi:hypothetical protein